nr:MAG TPA: hypothetical protein [Bacteriophage sp.]
MLHLLYLNICLLYLYNDQIYLVINLIQLHQKSFDQTRIQLFQ